MKALITFVLCAFFTASGFAQSTNTQMSNTEFNQVLQSARSHGLQSISSDTPKETLIAMFSGMSNDLSTAQARRLLSQINKDSGKLALARLLYSKVTDPSNFAQLSNLFKLDNYREEFRDWVSKSDSMADSENMWVNHPFA